MKTDNLKYDGLKDLAAGAQQGDLGVKESFMDVSDKGMCSCIGLGYSPIYDILPTPSTLPSVCSSLISFRMPFLTSAVLYCTWASLTVFVTHSATKSEFAYIVNGFLYVSCYLYITNCLRDRTFSYIFYCISSVASTLIRK